MKKKHPKVKLKLRFIEFGENEFYLDKKTRTRCLVFFETFIRVILPELRKEIENFWKEYEFKEHNPDILIENFLDYLEEKYEKENKI